MLGVLRNQAQEAAMLADQVNRTPAHPWNHPYRRFRDKLTDFEALASLLRQRLEEASTSWAFSDDGIARADELREQFENLDLLMLSLFARTTADFVSLLARESMLPLGSAEKLHYDLTALQASLERLKDPRLQGRADPTLETDLTVAAGTLADIIGRLPRLPDFTHAKPLPPRVLPPPQQQHAQQRGEPGGARPGEGRRKLPRTRRSTASLTPQSAR